MSKKPSCEELFLYNKQLKEKIKLLEKENLELKFKLQYIQDIIDNIEAILYIFDFNKNRIVWANQNFNKITGYSIVECLENNSKQNEENSQVFKNKLVQKSIESYNKDHLISPTIYRVKNKNGKLLWLLSVGGIFRKNHDGSPYLGVFIAVDFTQINKFNTLNVDLYSKDYLKRLDNKYLHLLTEKEKEVLKLLVDGLTTKETADILFRSIHTINAHKKNITKKLKFSKQTDLVRFAVKSGFDE